MPKYNLKRRQQLNLPYEYKYLIPAGKEWHNKSYDVWITEDVKNLIKEFKLKFDGNTIHFKSDVEVNNVKLFLNKLLTLTSPSFQQEVVGHATHYKTDFIDICFIVDTQEGFELLTINNTMKNYLYDLFTKVVKDGSDMDTWRKNIKPFIPVYTYR